MECLRIFGIGKEDGQRIIDRLGHTLINEHEKLFGGISAGTDIHSGPLEVCYRCWGKVYWSGSPNPPREAREEGSLPQWGVLLVDYSLSSISMVNLGESL